MSFAPNRNLLWTRVFVDELARSGLKHVVIAPGSRSTPLAIAFYEHPDIQHYIHLDERSGAFFALGIALATDAPIAIICTSGTAAANFYPAIVEANQSQVPLLVLTTDRPPELRHSGSNQTIDQIKMYGDYTLWSVDAPLPEANPDALTIRSLRTLANRAYAKANGLLKGVVHINFPFRSPLEPTPVETDHTELGYESRAERPFVTFSQGVMAPTSEQLDDLTAIISHFERGIIVCGTRCPSGEFPQAVADLAAQTGYPIFADVLSGVRLGVNSEAVIVGGYDNLAPTWEAPDIVIQFGGVPTSKTLNTYLNALQPAHRIMINPSGTWADDTHQLSAFLQADPALTCQQLVARLPYRAPSRWLQQIAAAEAAWWNYLATVALDFDGGLVKTLVDLLPSGSVLFAGNSLPVRHVDEFAHPSSKALQILANRGASGIDGVVSTAIGLVVGSGKPLTLLIGDISLYHDLNGLLALKRFGVKITIVLLNNDGGGIFQRLPVAQFDPPFNELFLTPHGLEFAPAAQMYGLEFVRVTDSTTLGEALAIAQASPRSYLIEYQSQATADLARRQQVKLAHRKETSHA